MDLYYLYNGCNNIYSFLNKEVNELTIEDKLIFKDPFVILFLYDLDTIKTKLDTLKKNNNKFTNIYGGSTNILDDGTKEYSQKKVEELRNKETKELGEKVKYRIKKNKHGGIVDAEKKVDALDSSMTNWRGKKKTQIDYEKKREEAKKDILGKRSWYDRAKLDGRTEVVAARKKDLEKMKESEKELKGTAFGGPNEKVKEKMKEMMDEKLNTSDLAQMEADAENEDTTDDWKKTVKKTIKVIIIIILCILMPIIPFVLLSYYSFQRLKDALRSDIVTL